MADLLNRIGNITSITPTVSSRVLSNVFNASSVMFTSTNSVRDVITMTLSTLVNNTTSWMNATSSIPEPMCTSPAFEEFPTDAFTPYQRAHGAIIFHILFVTYMFIALSIVCDDYFVASLDKVCEKLGFSEDVAGATFMAAGSSAPELFTAIIGVFITKGDVGVGTIVGSAVFNILFVIGICGLLLKEAVKLSWWPLFRDSICYSISVIVLIAVVGDSIVTWYESVIMLVMYAAYIVIMRFNRQLQAIVTNKFSQATTKLNANGMIAKHLTKFQGNYEQFDDDDDVFSATPTPEITVVEMSPVQTSADNYASKNSIKLTFEEAAFRILMGSYFRGRCRFRAAANLVICFQLRMKRDEAFLRRQKFQKLKRTSTMMSNPRSARNWLSMTLEGENFDSWKQVPSIEHDGVIHCIRWFVVYPIRAALYYTIPDCRKHRWERFFFATFIISIIWIALFSYVTVWMVTFIGYAFGIPDSVMGITFLAAGTSIPDAMASVFVAKQGMGDMAVSNSVGSNIFDILLGLAFPWFLKTAIVEPGSVAYINSGGMVFNIVLLFLTVIIMVGSIHLSGWRLSKYVGGTCLFVYGLYVAIAVMIECNVFGYVNAPMCTVV